ncbi:winged helix-turn-helix domain-containing protein, partial [Cylindrospermopsis raciborskii LB2897]|nr:winged helix-turn-helix domain-containing protein [Cylindrospermopsis raciborskii LB2897]
DPDVIRGYCLPFPLTHAQIGSAIGSTRVTVTRLMGKLRQRGLNIVCWQFGLGKYKPPT